MLPVVLPLLLDPWVVNEISGRKKAKEGQVSGKSPEERVKTWFTHFQRLLGEPPIVEHPDEEVIDPKLRRNQNGFRPKRTTVAQNLTLRRIIEVVKANHLPAIITFLDFKKVFDSAHRAKMRRILKAYGIPPNLLSAIEQMYTNTNTSARVQTPDGETDQFNISAGVLQGDT